MRTDLNVQAIRTKLKLTQAGLAEVAMVDVTTVWRWENIGVPERGPARAFLERLADDAAAVDLTHCEAGS
jgi:transcriptional regulator with XRE-family HTH domain